MGVVSRWQNLTWIGDVNYDCNYEDRDTELRLSKYQMVLDQAALLPEGDATAAKAKAIISRELFKLVAEPEDLANEGLEFNPEPVYHDPQNSQVPDTESKSNKSAAQAEPQFYVMRNGTIDLQSFGIPSGSQSGTSLNII